MKDTGRFLGDRIVPRARATARPFPRSTSWLGFAVAVIVLTTAWMALGGIIPFGVVAGAGVAADGGAAHLPLHSPGPTPPVPNASVCSSLVSNASLDASVANAYNVLANGSAPPGGNRSGTSGGSSSIGLLGYPSEANATILVRSWWTNVCSDPTFGQLIQSWGTTNFSWTSNVGSAGATWQFAMGWTEGCTIPQIGTFSGCRFTESWTGFLKSQNLTGPVTTASPPCGSLDCPIQVVEPVSGAPPTASPWSGPLAFLSAYGVFLGGLAVAVAVGVVAGRILHPTLPEPSAPLDPEKDDQKGGTAYAEPLDPLDDAI